MIKELNYSIQKYLKKKIDDNGLPGKIFIKDGKFCVLCRDQRYLQIKNIQIEGKQKVETKDFIQSLSNKNNYLN